MSTNSSSGANSIGPTLLLIAFIVLKLTHVIDWPWLWVLSPAWIPLALVALILAIGGIVAAIVATRGGRR